MQQDNIYEDVRLHIVGDCLHALSLEVEHVSITPIISTDKTFGLSVPEVRQSLVIVCKGKKTSRRRIFFSGKMAYQGNLSVSSLEATRQLTDEVCIVPWDYTLTAVEAFGQTDKRVALRLFFTHRLGLAFAPDFPEESFTWDAGYILRADV